MKYIAFFSIFLISSSFAMNSSSEKKSLALVTATSSRPSQLRSGISLAVSTQFRREKENETCCTLLGNVCSDLAVLTVTSPVWIFNNALEFAERKLKVE